MLYTEKQKQINGITLYGDLQDENKYWYLPSDKPVLADSGKKLQFTVVQPSGVDESSETDFKNGRATSGYLSMEVELGPTDDELAEVKKELGSDITLASVPFKEGSVQLVIFGTGESSDKLTIAGSTKPSLFGRQTAVFSIKLGSEEAQTLWTLLKGTAQTQVSIMYSLKFLGIMPAHNLKVEVDFNAVDKYSSHKFGADLGVNYDKQVVDGKDTTSTNLGVAASADVDVMIRDLVNEGSIKITNIDYTGTGEGSPLGSDDVSGMKLVKELLSNELFTPTPLPEENSSTIKEVSSAISDISKTAGQDNSKKEKVEPTQSDATKEADAKMEKVDGNELQQKTVSEEKPSSEGEVKGFKEVAGDDDKITKDEWNNAGLPEEDFDEYAEGEEDNKAVTETKYKEFKAAFEEAIKKKETATEESDSNDVAENTGDSKVSPKSSEASGTDNSKDGEKTTDDKTTSNKVTTVAVKANLNVGYSYKKREQSELVKRTYIFNKQQAQTFEYNPCGLLSTAGTDFDSEKQLALVRTDSDVFKTVQVTFRSALDFETYHIKEITVDFLHVFKDSVSKKDVRVEKTLILTKENPAQTITFDTDGFGTQTEGMVKPLGYSYRVKFSFDGDSEFVGFDKDFTGVVSSETIDTTDLSVLIDKNHMKGVQPVDIFLGSIEPSETGIKDVAVIIKPILADDTIGSNCQEVHFRNNDSHATALLNSNLCYKSEFCYTFNTDATSNIASYGSIPCTKKTMSVIGEKMASDEIIVNEPTRGMILIHTFNEEETFTDDIQGVTVKLTKDSKPYNINLSKKKPSCYFVYDYDSSKPVSILVDSVTVLRKNESGTVDRTSFEPAQKSLTEDDSELMLDIF